MSEPATNSLPRLMEQRWAEDGLFHKQIAMTWLASLVLMTVTSCNLSADDDEHPHEQTQTRIMTANGITANGITANGVTTRSLRTNGISGQGSVERNLPINRTALDGLYVNGIGVNGVGPDGTGSNRIVLSGLGSNGVVMPGIGLRDTGPDAIGIAPTGPLDGSLVDVSVNGFYLHGEGASSLVVAGNGLTDTGLDGLAINGSGPDGIRIRSVEARTLVVTEIDSARQPALEIALHHLVGCALPRGRSLTITRADGTDKILSGRRGLAPEWQDGALRPESEKKVRACLESAPLADLGLALNPAQERAFHKLLRYMVGCALPAGTEVTIYASDGSPRRYAGILGLAPEWQSQPLGPYGERAVSACLAARVNALGRPVVLSFRGPGLTTTPVERQLYTTHEGAFWGNVFAEQPYVAACTVDGGGLSGRVCADPDGDCGFTYVGSCADVCATHDADEGYYADCDGEAAVVDTFLNIRRRPLASGQDHACVIDQSGALRCWGQNDHGQLGNHTTTASAQPTPIDELDKDVVETSVGAAHSCARKRDGSLWCWGDNARGQVGDGSQLDRHGPELVTDLGSDVAMVDAGRSHTCVVKTDGSAWCWGDNQHGQLGDATTDPYRSLPARVSGLANNVARLSIASNADHTCAIEGDGSLSCWGDNQHGQLGDGTDIDRDAPVPIDSDARGAGFGAVTDVCTTVQYTCARRTDASLWCWGATHGPRPVAQLLPNGAGVDRLTCNSEQICVQSGGSQIWCHDGVL